MGKGHSGRANWHTGLLRRAFTGRKLVHSFYAVGVDGVEKEQKVERAPWARLGARVAAKNREKPQSQSIPLSQKAPSLEFGSFGHTRENLIFLR